MKKTKWFIYTVIIGLMPCFVRVFVFIFHNKHSFEHLFNESDFITFCLALNLTNINELEGKDFEDKVWKTKMIGISIIQIIVYSFILAISNVSDISKELFEKDYLKICTFIFAIVAFLFSYSIYNRLNVMPND
jgi:hypothetical protein